MVSKTTYLYDPRYFSKDNEDFSFKSSHTIEEFVPMKKPFEFAYGLKYQCTYLNERLYKLEGCLNLRLNNKMKTFPPFGNAFLPQSNNITLTDCHIMYTIKQMDICD